MKKTKIIRVDYTFYKRLINAKRLIEEKLNAKIDITELTRNIPIVVEVDKNTCSYNIRPIVINVKGRTKKRKAKLFIDEIFALPI
jgi:hypothetical protein